MRGRSVSRTVAGRVTITPCSDERINEPVGVGCGADEASHRGVQGGLGGGSTRDQNESHPITGQQVGGISVVNPPHCELI